MSKSKVTNSAPKKKAVQTTVKVISPIKTERVSRTELINKINNTRGRVFVSKHIDAKGEERTMTCIKGKGKNQLGYIGVYSVNDNGYRNINTRTALSAIIGNTEYKAPAPRKEK